MCDVFIGNLPFRAKGDEIKQFFIEESNTEPVFIRIPRNVDNRKKGYAYARFKDEEEAEKIIQALSGKDFQGREIKIEPSKTSIPLPPRKERSTKGPQCYYCKRYGHIAKNCASLPENRDKCFRCGDSGHRASDCPKSDGSDFFIGVCFNCNQRGHKSGDCPEASKTVCFRCKETGHLARDCPNSTGE